MQKDGSATLDLIGPLAQDTAAGRQQAQQVLATRGPSLPQATVAAYLAWADGDLTGARLLARTAAGADSSDLLAAQAAVHLYCSTGQLDEAEAIAEAAVRRHPDDGTAAALRALVHVRWLDHHAAEETATAALALSPDDPLAELVLAEALFANADLRLAADRLQDRSRHWDRLPDAATVTLWATLADLLLDDRRTEAALAIVDGPLLAAAPADPVGAVPVLARLALDEIDVAARWQRLAPHLADPGNWPAEPVRAAWAVFGLMHAGAEEALQTFVGGLRKQSAAAREDETAWRTLMPAVVTFLARQQQADHRNAAIAFNPLRPDLWALGGSQRLRDRLEDLFIASAMPAGLILWSVQTLEARRDRRPGLRWVHAHLATCYRSQGRLEEATEARFRADTGATSMPSGLAGAFKKPL